MKKNTDTMFIYYLFKKFKHFTYTKFLLIQTNSIRNNINRIKLLYSNISIRKYKFKTLEKYIQWMFSGNVQI